jgi:hypothetical protein
MLARIERPTRLAPGGGPTWARHGGCLALGRLGFRCNREVAGRSEQTKPKGSLRVGQDRDRLAREVCVVFVSPGRLRSLDLTLRKELGHHFFLSRREIEAFVKEWPAQHRVGSFPLELDLLEAAELLGRETLGEPLGELFVDLAASRNHGRVFSADQERRPALKFNRRATALDDLLGSKLEVRLNIRASQEKNGNRTLAETLVRWLAAVRLPGKSAETHGYSDQDPENCPSVAH